MHARVLIGQVKPGAMDELERIFDEAARAETMPQAGYRGAMLLGDQRIGKVIVITIWDSEEVMHAGEHSGYLQAQVAKVQHLLLGTPRRDHYEVGLEVGTLGARAEGAPARVTSGRAQSGQIPEIHRIFADDIASITQAQPGFIGLLVLGNAATNKSLVVSIWQLDEAMHASEHSGYYHEQMPKLAHLYEGPPTREHFVVLTHL